MGSHGRRFPGGLIVAFILCALAGCGNDDEIELLPTGISEERSETDRSAGATAPREPEEPIRKIRTVIVRETATFTHEAFIARLGGKKIKEVNEAFRILWEIFIFPDASGAVQEMNLTNPEVRSLREALIKSVTNAKSRGQRRYVADVECFLTFNAAFKEMDETARAELFERWKGLIGPAMPSQPLSSYYPLFWLRETLQIWTVGGKSWWWAFHALLKDPDFSWSQQEGARYEAPDGTIFRSRPERPGARR